MADEADPSMPLILQKAVTSFILPPGIFIVILLLLAAATWRRCRWPAAGMLLCAMTLWLCSTAPIADTLLARLEAEVPHVLPKEIEVDAIVLLGGGIYEGVPDLSGVGAPSEELQARMVTAVRAWQLLGRPMIVAGGTPPGHSQSEAIIMQRFLIDLGVPVDQIILEDRSRDTLENAKNVASICQNRNFRHPLVVSSAFHIRRARLAFAAAGLDIRTIGANFRSRPGSLYKWIHFLPSASSLAVTSMALREYIGLAYYQRALGLAERVPVGR